MSIEKTKATRKGRALTPAEHNEEWRDKFRHFTMRTNFQLGLTRPQLEFLCAVSRDCQWDRSLYKGPFAPDNFIASSHALEKRGLIVRRSQEVIQEQVKAHQKSKNWWADWLSSYDLTDAGWLVCELLKVTGLFVEPDLYVERTAKKRVQ